MVSVAREMERRGLDLPLLIGGATTSKQHTAVKIAPAYAQPTVHVLDASRVVGVMSDLLDPERRARLDRENRELQDRLREQHADQERKPLAADRGRAGERAARRRSSTCRRPPFTGARIVEPVARDARALHRLAVLLPRVGAEGQASRRSSSSRRRASSTTTRTRCSTTSFAARAPRLEGSTASGPRRPTATMSLSRTATRFHFLRQQTEYGDSRPNRSLADYVAPDRRPPRRVRGPDHRRRRARRPLRGRARRLPRDHGQGPRRPSRGGLRRVPARAAPGASGTRPAEPLEREPGRGALPRDPPGVRLPGVPRPLREAEALRAARGRRRRPRADGELRDAPGLERQRASTSRHPRRPLLLRSAASAATRPRTTPPGRACRSRRSSAGSRRTLPTSGRPQPRAGRLS